MSPTLTVLCCIVVLLISTGVLIGFRRPRRRPLPPAPPPVLRIGNRDHIRKDAFLAIAQDSLSILAISDVSLCRPEHLVRTLDQQSQPVVLLIHRNDDVSVPPLSATSAWGDVLDHDNLIALFTKNPLDLDSSKLHGLPLGIKWRWSRGRELAEEALDLLASNPDEVGRSFLERKSNGLFVSQMARSRREDPLYEVADQRSRQQIVQSVCQRTGVEQVEALDSSSYFEIMRSSRFVLSPAGKGLDTHRTWESLLCGAIPIVPSSSLNPLYEDLPVAVVDSFDIVTDAWMAEQYQNVRTELKAGGYRFEKLFMPYWRQTIRNLAKHESRKSPSKIAPEPHR